MRVQLLWLTIAWAQLVLAKSKDKATALALAGGDSSKKAESLSSLGFHLLPNSIVKIEEALAQNATILYSVSSAGVHDCAETCAAEMQTGCNLFVFSKKSSKCVLFDCNTPSVCEFEDNHPAYTAAVRVLDKGHDRHTHTYRECFPKFRCVTSGECVPLSFTCDGFVDCGDESDELGCYTDYEDNSDRKVSKYERAYQKHTSNFAGGDVDARLRPAPDKQRNLKSSGHDGAALSPEAVPGSAQIRTGNEPAQVPRLDRHRDIYAEDSMRDFKEDVAGRFGSDELTGAEDDEEERQSETKERGLNRKDKENELNELRKPTEGIVRDRETLSGRESQSGASDTDVEHDQNERVKAPHLSAHPFFDWLSEFMSEDRVRQLTVLDIYQMTLKACLSEVEKDLCGKSVEVKYFYNASSQQCVSHRFSLCATDMNRFHTRQDCLAVCGSIETQLQSEASHSELNRHEEQQSNQRKEKTPPVMKEEESNMSPSSDFGPQNPRSSSLKHGRTTGYSYKDEEEEEDPMEEDPGSVSSKNRWGVREGGYRGGSQFQSMRDRLRALEQSESVKNQEPAYWEQMHHGNSPSSDIHAKTFPDESSESRLTLEQPAIISVQFNHVESKPSLEGNREVGRSAVGIGDTEKPGGADTGDVRNKKSNSSSSRGWELSAAIPLVLGLSLFLLFSVLLAIRCYFWNRYPISARHRLNRFFKDPNDYLVDGMYL